MKLTIRTTDPLTVDNTILRAAAECSTLMVVEQVLGLRAKDDIAPLRSGQAAHSALASWHETEGDAEKALAIFEQEYREWSSENVPSTDRLSWQNLDVVLRAWFRAHDFDALPYTVESIEAGFRIELFPGVHFVGLLDVLGRAKSDGTPRVVEHKTTGSVTQWWKEQWASSSQVTGYLRGASEVLDETVVAAYINAVEFRAVPKSDRQCREHGTMYSECGPLHCNHEIISVQRQPWQLYQWEQTAKKLVRKVKRAATDAAFLFNQDGEVEDAEWEVVQKFIQRFSQEGTFTGHCRFCPLKDFCASGRRHRSMLMHHPWRPEEMVTITKTSETTRRETTA